MISYPEAMTIIGCFFAIGWTFIKAKGNTNNACRLHGPLMSDIASIKQSIVNLTVYVLKEAEKEGRDIQQEIINAMMKK